MLLIGILDRGIGLLDAEEKGINLGDEHKDLSRDPYTMPHDLLL